MFVARVRVCFLAITVFLAGMICCYAPFRGAITRPSKRFLVNFALMLVWIMGVCFRKFCMGLRVTSLPVGQPVSSLREAWSLLMPVIPVFFGAQLSTKNQEHFL